MMAKTATTGCLLTLMALYFLSNSVANSARGGYQGDSWAQGRRLSLLAQHQRLAGDEGRETDSDSLLRRKRDSAVNGGRGVDGAKWVDSSAGDVNNSEFLKEADNDAVQQEQPTLLSSDEQVAAPKRKWSDKNVRIWGKRKWSSKGLHLWGKRQDDEARDEDMMGSEGKENRVRDWSDWERQQNGMHGLEREGEEKRHRWAKNNLKIWGKRDADTEESAEDDLAEIRMKVLGNRLDSEESNSDGLQGTNSYGNRISDYLRKRSNLPNYGAEQKWGKKGWANNNVRIWG